MTPGDASNAPINDAAKPATSPPIDSELAADCARLILHLSNPVCARHDWWLTAMGLEREVVEAIITAYPAMFEIDRNPASGATWQFRIWLAKPAETVPQHSIAIQKPSQSAEKFPISAEQEKQMRWRGPSPDMARRRGSNISPQNVQHRARVPLIILPPESP